MFSVFFNFKIVILHHTLNVIACTWGIRSWIHCAYYWLVIDLIWVIYFRIYPGVVNSQSWLCTRRGAYVYLRWKLWKLDSHINMVHHRSQSGSVRFRQLFIKTKVFCNNYCVRFRWWEILNFRFLWGYNSLHCVTVRVKIFIS